MTELLMQPQPQLEAHRPACFEASPAAGRVAGPPSIRRLTVTAGLSEPAEFAVAQTRQARPPRPRR